MSNIEKIEEEIITECGLPDHGIIMPKDKYDHAIDYLIDNPEDIHDAWANPSEYGATLVVGKVREANSLGS